MAERKNVRGVLDVAARLGTIKASMDDGLPGQARAQTDDLVAETLLAIADLAPILGGKWAQEMASMARRAYRISAGRTEHTDQ